MPAPTMDALFDQVKGLVTPYARHFSVHEDTADIYDLEEELPHNRTQFAIVQKKPRDVRLYFYPLHVFPDLRDILPPAVQAHIVSKYVVKLTELPAPAKRALMQLIAAAWSRIAAIRTLDPKHPYYKKFDLDDTFAFLKALLVPHANKFQVHIDEPHGYTLEQRLPDTSTEVASLFRRKNAVDLGFVALDEFPSLKVPAELAPRMTKNRILRFKTITPEEHAATARLVADVTKFVSARIKKNPSRPYDQA